MYICVCIYTYVYIPPLFLWGGTNPPPPFWKPLKTHAFLDFRGSEIPPTSPKGGEEGRGRILEITKRVMETNQNACVSGFQKFSDFISPSSPPCPPHHLPLHPPRPPGGRTGGGGEISEWQNVKCLAKSCIVLWEPHKTQWFLEFSGSEEKFRDDET